jgi:hypothetical protein
MGTYGNGDGKALVARKGCDACAHPARTEIDQQLRRGIEVRLVSEQFGLNAAGLKFHHLRHSAAVQRVPTDPQQLLIDLDFVRTMTVDCAIASAAEGNRATVLSALREFRECTRAIADLIGAKESLRGSTRQPFWDDLKNRLCALIERHPELKAEILEILAVEDDRDDGAN